MKSISQQLSIVSIIFFLLVTLVACQGEQVLESTSIASLGPPISATGSEPIEPIPAVASLDQDKVALGRQLFHDPQFSYNNSVSCASCHTLTKGGTDRRIHSVGVDGQVGTLNAPTVLNSSFHFKQFWDGRSESMESQIDGPLHSAHEMNSNWDEVISKLQRSSEYQSAFRELYSDGITEQTAKDALVTFEQSLYTPNAPFDQFLQGQTNALTDTEKEGYRRFKDYGCVSCHQGVLLGGNLFQKFGVFGNYLNDRGNITEADLGRFNVTKREEDRYAFKVPSLRNVTLTAPYFHDGSAETLDEAVKVMFKYQLGREVSQQDIDVIIEFLTTLTGEFEGVSQ